MQNFSRKTTENKNLDRQRASTDEGEEFADEQRQSTASNTRIFFQNAVFKLSGRPQAHRFCLT
ncbi:hypothetical protein BEN47_06455 [Hymenobacter lapidarius]|uniref:Uncharacterized protein n=1 Tax=Hymenobacter lapidarius TaxID=1908237 RepID=A0A1G1SQK1_9BACT|nr:hypothetical protein BEN47_06455 [Hymenobacter lapidarius]